jgi:hypothetical protein
MSKEKEERGQAAPGRQTSAPGKGPAASLAGLGTSPGAADSRDAADALRQAASSNVIRITPFMHVRDLEVALAFVSRLGFATHHRVGEQYAYVDREGAGLRIMASAEAYVFEGSGRHRFAYYLDVRDVGAIHEELKDFLASLPEEDVHGPADKPYGQRELLVRGPDGQLFVFGQAMGRE